MAEFALRGRVALVTGAARGIGSRRPACSTSAAPRWWCATIDPAATGAGGPAGSGERALDYPADVTDR
jgi:NAD(P)-dependent dehydrogenase (short-subunit alcohol dehydrogenase family)